MWVSMCVYVGECVCLLLMLIHTNPNPRTCRAFIDFRVSDHNRTQKAIQESSFFGFVLKIRFDSFPTCYCSFWIVRL